MDEFDGREEIGPQQEEEIDQEREDRMVQEEIRRDMNDNFEVPVDKELEKMCITPFSSIFSAKINGVPILNKDFGTSRLSKRAAGFVGLTMSGISATDGNPRLCLVQGDYAQTVGTFLTVQASVGGWGRSMAHTRIGRKELTINEKERKPPEQQSGGLGGLLPWKSGR